VPISPYIPYKLEEGFIMKSRISIIIILAFVVCTFQMTGCRTKQNVPSDEQIITNTLLSDYENHTNDINTSNHANRVIIYLFDSESQHILNSIDNEHLVDLFSSHNDDIINDIYKFSYDYSFMIDGERWDYCSESGAFCNNSKNQSFIVSESEKNEVNTIIQSISKQLYE
jgi:hypothetical protein